MMAGPHVRADVPTFGTLPPRTVRLADCSLTGATRPLPGVTHHYVHANGLRFHAAEAGRHADELRVRVLDGGHYLPEERPDQVADAARELTQRSAVATSDSTGAVIIAFQ